MSTKARAVLDEIKALSPEERREVLNELAQIEARQRAWDEQKETLRQMQARHTGRGLLNRLLEVRTKERRRG